MVSVSFGHGGEGGHALADIEGAEGGVAGEVDHVEVFEFEEHEVDEFFADSLVAVAGEDFEEGDVGAEDAVGDGGDEADDFVAFFGEDEMGASLEESEVGLGVGVFGPAFEEALQVFGQHAVELVRVGDHPGYCVRKLFQKIITNRKTSVYNIGQEANINGCKHFSSEEI